MAVLSMYTTSLNQSPMATSPPTAVPVPAAFPSHVRSYVPDEQANTPLHPEQRPKTTPVRPVDGGGTGRIGGSARDWDVDMRERGSRGGRPSGDETVALVIVGGLGRGVGANEVGLAAWRVGSRGNVREDGGSMLEEEEEDGTSLWCCLCLFGLVWLIVRLF